MPWLLVLFWSSLVVKVSTNYRVVNNTTYMPCILATPKIEFGELNNTVMLDDKLLDTGQKARIGNVEYIVELQYIGCVPLSNTDDIKHISVSMSLDIGNSACGDINYTVIGLSSREGDSPCLWFGDDIKNRTNRLDDCNTKCGAYVCGSNGSVSIYEKVEEWKRPCLGN